MKAWSQFKRQIGHTFLTTLVNLFLGVTASLLLARWLGAELRGYLGVVQQTVALAGFFLLLGMDISFVRYGATGLENRRVLFGNALIFNLAAGLLGTIGFLVLGLFVYGRVEYAWLLPSWIILGALILPLFLNQQIQASLLRGWGRIEWVNRASMLFVMFDLTLLLIFHGMNVLDVKRALLAQAVSLLAAGAILLILSFKETEFGRPRLSHELLERQWRFGRKAYLNEILWKLNCRLDVYLVLYFLSPTGVGRYLVAFAIAEMVWNVPGSIAFVLFPSVAASVGARTPRQTLKLIRYLAVVIIGVGVLAGGIGSVVIPFLGPSYGRESVLALWLLMPGVILYSLGKILHSDFAGRGHPEQATLPFAAGLILTILLDLLMIPRWGIRGAAVASSLAYTTITTLLLVRFLGMHKLSLEDLLLSGSRDGDREGRI